GRGWGRERIDVCGGWRGAGVLAMSDEEAHCYEDRLLRIIAPRDLRAGDWRERRYDDLPQYRPPTWLMTGIWTTEGSGFAPAPPREESDFTRPPAREAYPEAREANPDSELIAGEREGASGPERYEVPDSGDVRARDTEQPKTRDPRLERYRER